MNRSRFIFFLVVLGVVFGIARYNSRHMTQTTTTSPGASATPRLRPESVASPLGAKPASPPTSPVALAQAGSTEDFKKAAERIMPSVIALSVFDTSGKLLHEGTGFFVSADGNVVTSRSLVDGGANAVAKTADGKLYDVSGILSEGQSTDLAMLRAKVKDRVPFITWSKTASFAIGDRLAVVSSPLHRQVSAVSETAIAGRKADTGSEWLELTAPVPGESLGAPVLNAKGDVLGFVALQRGEGPAVNVVRLSSTIDSVLVHLDKQAKPAWAAAGNAGPPPPAAGPSPTPKATPPVKMRLIYNPLPRYPAEARHSLFPLKGTGRYRIRFGSDGLARDVQIVQPSRSQTLDSAAVEALRKWKATPGQTWSVDVPVTFQP
jgi:TonB family protein